MTKRLFDIAPWSIYTTTLDKDNKRLQESLTAIGNGYMGMRGNFEEGYSGDTHQGTYIAGVWFPDKTRVGWWKNGYPHYFGKVINATNFMAIDILIDGEKVDLAHDEIESFALELDMQKGILTRDVVINKHNKQIQLHFERFLSLAIPELAVFSVRVSALNHEISVTFVPKLDGNVHNEDSNYDEQFWQEEQKGDAPCYLQMKTIANPFDVPQFTVLTAMENFVSKPSDFTSTLSNRLVTQETTVNLQANEEVTFIKNVAVITSRDVADDDQLNKAKEILHIAKETGYEQLKIDHVTLWAKRWAKADVVINGDDAAQQGIRFNIFQLFSTYYGEDSRLNIGPKGFTGEKYGGATYWDTEAYIVPMYLALADQEVTRELLEYRHNQLPQAYHNAQQQGLKGALYPMVTFTGVECHNEWEITFEEIHRNGAVAYAIYDYTNYTGDSSYVLEKGIDVLVGISRFWADRVHFSKRKSLYMIHGVTGPNEYENNVNNNYHTNNIAKWTLNYTLSVLKQVSENKKAELNITDEELEKWQTISQNMYLPYDEELGVFVQHDTFLDKDLRLVSDLSPEDRPLNQKWSWDKILRSPFIKQADVLQSLYFFNAMYTTEEKRRNFEFYEPMTVHESSLSPSIHAILAAELQKEDKAVELYERTARLDLDNYNNDTEDGLHITSMSGSWLAIVQGFAGMRVIQGKLQFAPFLPKQWASYQFKINFRNRLIEVSVDKHQVKFVLMGEALTLKVFDTVYTLENELMINY